MSLVEAILSFDGKHVGDLKAAVAVFANGDAPVLVEFCSSGDPEHRVAATWIVRALLEEGRGASLDLSLVFTRFQKESEWGALLHLLQAVQWAPEAALDHRTAVEALLEHKKTLVAVWALDALVRIDLERGEGLEQARCQVDAALKHEKASMRARARHLAPLLGL